jgi:hypothetical protein
VEGEGTLAALVGDRKKGDAVSAAVATYQQEVAKRGA